VSVVLCCHGHHFWYYTLREKNEVWREEQAICNALAYQLELSRLSNYNLEPCLVESKQIHIYHGVARENQLDHCFFICALIRPGCFPDDMNTVDYDFPDLFSELKAMQNVWTKARSNNTSLSQPRTYLESKELRSHSDTLKVQMSWGNHVFSLPVSVRAEQFGFDDPY
jgi:acetyl-CoA carboxylase/biotin carboxylase 1